MNLTTKLNLWEKSQLITPAQKEAILTFENNAKRPLLYYALLFLSSFCIGLGIIAVIAANWDAISATVKLTADFLLLVLAAGAIYKTSENNKILAKESLILVFAILIMASIGLIAQIYNLPPHGLRAVLLWSLLTLPLLAFTQKPFLAAIWLPAFLCSSFDTLLEIKAFSTFIETINNQAPGWLSWLGLFALFGIWRIFKLFNRSAVTQTALRFWFITGTILYVLCAEIGGSYLFYNNYRHLHMELYQPFSAYVYWFFSAAFLALLYYRKKEPAAPYLNTLLIIMIFTLSAQNIGINHRLIMDILCAALSISLLLIVQISAYQDNRLKLMNLASLLIAARFFIIYLQVFGSLLSTGIGLIISGIVFFIIARIWQNIRKRLMNKLKEN